jgi:hypothetical protein
MGWIAAFNSKSKGPFTTMGQLTSLGQSLSSVTIRMPARDLYNFRLFVFHASILDKKERRVRHVRLAARAFKRVRLLLLVTTVPDTREPSIVAKSTSSLWNKECRAPQRLQLLAYAVHYLVLLCTLAVSSVFTNLKRHGGEIL